MISHPSKLPFLSDRVLLAVAAILVSFGVLMIYSTTGVAAQERFGDAYFFVKRQGVAALLGAVLLVLCSYVRIERLQRFTALFFFLSVLLLAVVLIPGVGVSAGGARRWFDLGVARFQPGELAKLLMVLFLAGFLARNEQHLQDFKIGILKPMLCVFAVAGLLLLQPDFGSAAIVAAVVLAMMFVAGVRLKYFAIGALLLAASAAVMVLVSPYRTSRVVSFLFPWNDPSGKGYQLIQSLIAVGSGKVSGVGLGESQQKLLFLPAAHTDFIFAVVAEELGLVGCILLVALFVLLLWQGILLAGRFADDTYRFSLAIGLTLLIVLPALLNVGIVLGLLPTKGMVLPLVSYGGSSLIVSLMVVGLLLSLSRSLVEQAR